MQPVVRLCSPAFFSPDRDRCDFVLDMSVERGTPEYCRASLIACKLCTSAKCCAHICHPASSPHAHLDIPDLGAQVLNIILRHQLRAGFEVAYNALQASYKPLDLGTLCGDGRKKLCVRRLRLGKFGVHIYGLFFEEGHQVR